MGWTVNRRVLAGFSLILLLLLVIAAIGYSALQNTLHWNERERYEQRRNELAAEAGRQFSDANLSYLRSLLQPGDTRWVREREESLEHSRALVQQLADSAQSGEFRDLWRRVLPLLDRWEEAVRQSLAAAAAGNRDEALRLRDARQLPVAQEIQRALEANIAEERRVTALVAREADENAGDNQRLILFSALAALALGIGAGVLLGRSVTGPLRETTGVLASSAAEILAAAREQAQGASQSMAAVTETAATADQVAQTAEQAAQRARAVADTAQRTAEIGRTGQAAVEEAVSVSGAVGSQVESIAESILALAEQAQAIGEIIASVDDIAGQTNLLALNAAIEASRAGEYGRGFSVVAAEIRSLADQSRAATVQVRQILGEIQRATSTAVMTTEEGTKLVARGSRQVQQAGETIRLLADTAADAAQAAVQIVASVGQQAAGMVQIRQAMRDIQAATQQNLAATQQTERAAQDLSRMGNALLELVGGRHEEV